MVGQVEAPVVVRTILEINQSQFVIWSLELWPYQNVSFLEVVMCEDNGAVDLRQKFPFEEKALQKHEKELLKITKKAWIRAYAHDTFPHI